MTPSDDSLGPTTSGAVTLLDVLRRAEQGGYGTQQIVRDPGLIECVACAVVGSPADFAVVHHRRLEGASDAADMMLVAWTRCPNCAANGVLVVGFGPNATSADDEVLRQLDLGSSTTSPDPSQ